MAKHHLNNLAHKELKMQHLENCSRSIAKPHVVHVSSCRWILPSMSECCLWWFERNSIRWKINTSFYQSDHITLLNSNFAHIFKGTSFGMTDFIWRANLMSDFRAVGNSEWSVNHTFIRQIFAPILSSATLSNIIKKMACCLFSTKPLSGLMLTCHCPLKQASVKLWSNFNNFYSRKLIVKCCLQKLAIWFKP